MNEYDNPYSELGAWYAGELACYAGASRDACPYIQNSSPAKLWLQGFDAASVHRCAWEESNHARAAA